MGWVLAVCFVIIIVASLGEFMVRKENSSALFADTRFSGALFLTLSMIYIIIILGFGAIYFILSLEDIVLVAHNELKQVSVLGSLIESIYFSGVTLLTIGYGDIVPVGLGRLIAIVEALIGYILPAAFVLKVVQFQYRNRTVDK